MTFTVWTGFDAPYTIDIETMDDIAALAERYGWERLTIDMRELTILVGAWEEG